MSQPSGSALLRRIAREHRRVLLPLAVLIAANIIIYAVVVYPMAQRVANIEESGRAARTDLATARRDFDQANGTLTGKDRAAQELSTFYSSVLPRGLAGARRLTTLRLQQLARDAGLVWSRVAAQEVAPVTGSTLKQLKIVMDPSGNYTNMRAFIHQLEIAPEFVVIDNVLLSEGADEGTLVVNLELSTYYQDGAQ